MSNATGTQPGLPIYEALAERLREAIGRGEYRPGDLLGSEHELARQENISRMTVRKASELLVNEGLLERRPGKGLYVAGKPDTAVRLIQVVAGNLTWEPCLQVARGVQAAAREQGIQVQLYDAHGDEDLDLEMVRGLAGGPARGAVIISTHSHALNEVLFGLKIEGFPFVLVDERFRDILVPSVTADNHRGGYEVAQLLLEHGHRRIAFIGDLVASTVQERVAGMRDAMNDAAVAMDRSLVFDVSGETDRLGDWSARVEDAFAAAMNSPKRPSAIFCSCDAVARSVYRAASRMGIEIPSDLSVVGFDDDPLAEWLTPGLTTVRQPFSGMGRAAMELLTGHMTGTSTQPEQRVLPVELIRRQSVAPARAQE